MRIPLIAIQLFIFTLFTSDLLGQTNGTLTFSFTQIAQSPTYQGTRNALAVWIQTGSTAGGTFVKTKLRYAGAGQGTSDHLPTFSVAAGGTAGNCMATSVNITDATTGATLSNFGARSITWDGKNVSGTSNGTTVADGTYSVAIQATWDHGTSGTVTNYFSFTKGPTAVTTTFPNTAQFSNISLTWTPAVTNTLSTGTITGSPFCAGQTGISIPFTASGTFTSGNVFTAQLSSSTGSFTTPTTLGTLTSTALTGTITSSVALPNTAGTAYRIRVVASTPATTGTDNGTNLTINAAPTTANAGPDQSICTTSSATMAANTPTVGTGAWTLVSGTGTINSSSSATTTITGLGTGANTFRWTISNANCTPSTDDIILTGVAPPTTANAGPDQSVCTNSSVTMAGNNPTTGTGVWSLVGGAGTITTPSSATTTITGLGAGANTFRWTTSNGSCTASADNVIITGVSVPTIANAGPDQSLCTTASATMAANAASSGTGLWTLINGAGTITTPSSATTTITGLGAGSNTFRWTISNSPCTASTDDIIITGNAAPTTANAGADQNVCVNSLATLAGNTPAIGTGTWTRIAGTGTITTPTSASSTITGLGVGANTFRWTISNGTCSSSTDDVIITGVAVPTIANAGPDQTACATSATLAGNTPVTGTAIWSLVSGTGTITSPTSPTSTVTGLAAGTNTFRWTISNGVCTTSTDDVIITQAGTITTANAGPDQNICGTSATLAGNVPTTGIGAWSLVSGSGSITSPSNASSGITGLGLGANTFRWTISNGACTPSTDDVIITGYASPTVANAGVDETVCATSITLSGNTPSIGSGIWSLVSGTGTIISPSSPTSTVSGLSAGTNTFRWTISNGPCTSSTDDVIITQAGTITNANAGADQSLCSTSTTLAGNSPTTGTGSWSLVSGAGTISNSSSATSTVTGLGLGSNTFRWTITNGSCTPSTDDVIISVVASPTPANAGTDQSVCGTSASLSGNTAAIGTGIWSLVSGSGTIANSASSTSTITGLGVGANTFRWTISNGICTPSTDDVIITGVAAPTISNAGQDQNVCGSSATLVGNTPSVGSGVWTLVSGTGTFSNAGSPSSLVTALGVGSNTFRWTISNGICTSSTDDVIITGVASPSIANAGTDQNICNTNATLSGNSPSIGTGAWSLVSGSGTIISASNPASGITGLGAGANTFRWSISNGICPASTDDVIITAVSLPTQANAGPDQSACITSAVMAGNAPSSGSGQWSLVNGTGNIITPSSPTTSITGLGAGANTFRWTISNGTCTPTTDDVVITQNCPVSITMGVVPTGPFCSSTSYAIAVPFTYSGTFTGAFTAELSDASGSFANPVVIGTGSNSPIAALIPSVTVTGTGYRIRVKNSAPSAVSGDNGSNISINTCLAIHTGSVSGSPYCSTSSYDMIVPFTTTGGTFTGTFIVELSNSAGNFSFPTTIGYSTTSPINATIPFGIASGTNYRVRVSNTSMNITGSDNGTDLSINTCSGISTGVLNYSALEGVNVYPNPNHGNFTMTTDGLDGEVNIEVTSALGELVLRKENIQNNGGNIIIEIPNAQAGMYFIKIYAGNKVGIKKFAIN